MVPGGGYCAHGLAPREQPEQGDHAELLRKQGFYYRLYQSQFAETVGVEAAGRAAPPILQPAG